MKIVIISVNHRKDKWGFELDDGEFLYRFGGVYSSKYAAKRGAQRWLNRIADAKIVDENNE